MFCCVCVVVVFIHQLSPNERAEREENQLLSSVGRTQNFFCPGFCIHMSCRSQSGLLIIPWILVFWNMEINVIMSELGFFRLFG